jgi:NADH dehydrogenase
VEEIRADGIRLSTGEWVPTRHVGWTAGVKPHPVVAHLGLPLDDDGRISTDSKCSVQGFEDVWALGDAAGVPDPARPGHPSPPTSQHVIRQAKVVAYNIACALRGSRRRRRFRYKTLGVFVDMGRHQAVASTLGIMWRGFPAWFLARTYHLIMIPGAKRKTRLVTDWTVSLLFGRDSSELGQLGHPPSLDGDRLTRHSSEPTPRSGQPDDRETPAS